MQNGYILQYVRTAAHRLAGAGPQRERLQDAVRILRTLSLHHHDEDIRYVDAFREIYGRIDRINDLTEDDMTETGRKIIDLHVVVARDWYRQELPNHNEGTENR